MSAKPLFRPLALAVLSALALLPAAAQAGRLADVVRAEVLPGWRTDQGSNMMALRLTLAPGWKTYWRSPGEAGIPPDFDWTGSRNMRAVDLHWPRPEVFEFNGMQTIGYDRELVLPIEVWPRDAGAAVEVRVRVDLGVCRDVCVPATLSVSAELPTIVAPPDPAIRAALRDRPLSAAEAGVVGHSCAIDAVAGGLRVTAEIDLPPLGTPEAAVIELERGGAWVSEAMVRRDGNRLTATSDMLSLAGGAVAFSRSDLRITLIGKGRAVEIAGCPGR